ncbi:MAG TPA: site-2 protease family protein [Phenylobacterium sp.]|nr:site-2 protease family protein [Phenylobacterium sp.]
MEDATRQPPVSHASGNPILLIVTGWLAAAAGLTIKPEWAGPLTFVFVCLGWVLAVGVHEFCHAWVAYRAGDHTVAEKGYLSFDPRRYADLQTTIVFPLLALALGGIGFPGGAVYLREDLMRGRWWRAAASLAGPAGTLAVLIALAAVLRLWTPPPGQQALVDAVAFLALLQATALVLNLLPVPGLDGYGAIRAFLPQGARVAMRRIEPLAPLILLGLLFFVPAVSSLLFGLAFLITYLMGLPDGPMIAGLQAFQFWK